METVLEDALARCGYVIIHPQEMPVQDQIGTYAAASRLVFADGSAVHLWSLVARPGQEVAVVLRRPLNTLFGRWFRKLDCPKPVFIDARIADFRRRDEASSRSTALIDLRAVWTRLRDLGFHGDTAPLGPDPTAMAAWAAALPPSFRRPGEPPFAMDDHSRQVLAQFRRVSLAGASAAPQSGYADAAEPG
jgi:hypothetical protein